MSESSKFEQRAAVKMRAVRERHGMTQAQVAEGIGLARVRVVELEGGRRVLRLSLIHQLAAVFGMSPLELLTEITAQD